MRKLFYIVLPVILISAGAWAVTKPDPPSPERTAMEETFAMARNGYRLGLVLSTISPHLRDDLKIDSGAVIEEVIPDSPAAKAGLKEGDIILKIDGTKIESDRDIRKTLREMENPKEMTLDVLRDGKPLTVRVTPEKREMNLIHHFGGPYLGVESEEIDQDLANYFQVQPNSGVLVTRVESDSPAMKGGLKSGDVITQINGKKVATPVELRDALKDVKEGESVSVTVLRHGKVQNVTVTPEKRQFPRLGEWKELKDLPNLPELRNFAESPEFRESMQDIRRQMEELKNQMKDLHLRKQDLDQFKQQMEKEMDQLRQELKKTD
jgi:membrane-associated protease RseP (regulator of RpoE activity)